MAITDADKNSFINRLQRHLSSAPAYKVALYLYEKSLLAGRLETPVMKIPDIVSDLGYKKRNPVDKALAYLVEKKIIRRTSHGHNGVVCEMIIRDMPKPARRKIKLSKLKK